VELLLSEMTSGGQYIASREGIKMDPVKDFVPYVDSIVNGEVLEVQQMDEDTYIVKFAIPLSNLEISLGGITNVWPIVAGEVFNFYFIKKAALIELELPQSFENYYQGPRFGIKGMRDLLGVKKGPFFGSIIKPNVGLDPEGVAHVVELHAKAGFNLVKDDEICVNPKICPLQERIRKIAEILDRVEQKTGKKVLYIANVTSDFSVINKNAEIAINGGAGGLMIDPLCTGLSIIDFLRRNYNVPIYVHRVGYGLFCSGPSFLIKYEIFLKLFKLLGADFSHVGGIWGNIDIEGTKRKIDKYLYILRDESLKNATWPVVTGISLENMADYYSFYGDDTLFMDHIGIYKDEKSARNKLQSLKKKIK
jgi:ribulose 1,5-bisphosphate carboxylase large subunit-like protein